MMSSDRIDLSTLGFEISFAANSDTDLLSYCDCDCDCHNDEDESQSRGVLQPMIVQEEDVRYDIYADDDVSGVSSASTYSLSDVDDHDDDEDSKDRPPRKPMPKRSFGPGRTILTKAELGYEDLGYEDLGYGPAQPQSGYGESPAAAAVAPPSRGSMGIKRLSMGRPVENRRSMGMGRRTTNESRSILRRRSTMASASTASSYASNKMRKAHTGKRRPSQRERMLRRSTQERLSRTAATSERQLSPCNRLTLQDLGCSDIFLVTTPSDRKRMPRTVSLQYDQEVTNHSSFTPTAVSLKFDQKGHMPSRVSLSFDQRAPRKGSLEFSEAIAYLPRRATIGGVAATGGPSRRASVESHQSSNHLHHGKPCRLSCLSHESSVASLMGFFPPSLSLKRSQTDGSVGYERRRSSNGGAGRRSSSIGFCPHHESMKTLKPTTLKRSQTDGSVEACTSEQQQQQQGRRRSSCGCRRSSCGGSIVRKGSLDFSVGTSQLPRRMSIGQSSTGTMNDDSSRNNNHNHNHNHNHNSHTGRACCHRKGSMAPGRVPRKHIHRTAISPVRSPVQGGGRRNLSPKRKGQMIGHGLTLQHVGAVDFLTREPSWTNLNQQPTAVSRVA